MSHSSMTAIDNTGEHPPTLETLWRQYAPLLSAYRAQPSVVAFASLPHPDSVTAELQRHRNDTVTSHECGEGAHAKPAVAKWVGARREVLGSTETNVRALSCSRQDTLVWVVDAHADESVRALMFSPWDIPYLKTGNGSSKHLSHIDASGRIYTVTHTQTNIHTHKYIHICAFICTLHCCCA